MLPPEVGEACHAAGRDSRESIRANKRDAARHKLYGGPASMPLLCWLSTSAGLRNLLALAIAKRPKTRKPPQGAAFKRPHQRLVWLRGSDFNLLPSGY